MKILFTGVALGAGFKGGEIVPTLTVGAAFGYLMSLVTGLPVGLCASVGNGMPVRKRDKLSGVHDVHGI